MKRFWVVVLCVVLLCEAVSIGAQEPERSPVVLLPGLRLFGLDVDVGYRGLSPVPGVDTIFWATVGGGYETKTYYRNPADDSPLAAGDLSVDAATAPFYQRVNGDWGLGISQGILWNPEIEANFLEAFFFYKGRYSQYVNEESTEQLLFESRLADRQGIFQNSFLGGLSLMGLVPDVRHKTIRGYYAEASAEWGPAFLGNTIFGRADFLRFNITAMGFLPIYDANPESFANVFSVYLGEFFSVDYVVGDSIPLNVRQTFGGRDPRTGLGGAVRGVDDGRYDTTFKAVNNVEVRMNLPAIVLPDLVPGIVAYFDAGYYDFADYTKSGTVFSTGAGVYLNLLDLAYLAAYSNYLLNDTNLDGTQWTPFELEFGLHF